MSDDQQRTGRARAVRALVLLLVVAVSVYVLFTWVFPWITELGFSPALDV